MGDPNGTSTTNRHETALQSATEPTATLGIAGVGLIGGSIAAAVKRRGVFCRVIGFGRSLDRLEAAREAGLIDDATTDYELAREVDLFVSCLPVDRIADSVRRAAVVMRPGTLTTDAGSVKESICRAIGSEPASGVTFLGSHPLAGSEKQGHVHADADLFCNRLCVVTPTGVEPPEAAQRLRNFWRNLGSDVVELDPARHDAVLARTSHLPHLVAAALSALPTDEELRFGAGGFRDTTRVASGDADLWTAILIANAASVEATLAEFLVECDRFRAALACGDAAAIREMLTTAKLRRDRFTELFNHNTP